MSYATKYTVPFKSIKNSAYTIEIQEEGFSGQVTELTGAPSPFVVSIDDEDFLYTPVRFSTAKLSLVGSDYLRELYSTQYQQFRVILKKDSSIVWRGFIKPEIYTQDYTDIDFELQIECISAMSTLEFIDYTIFGNSYAFVSLWDLLKKCIASSKADYNYIFIPHVYAKSETDYNSYANVLANMTISEQNFFDEDGKPMKLKEVLEEICKLLNWTCVDWMGSLYFVDIDHIGEYYQYNADMLTYSIIEFSDINIQQIGFAGSNNTLDVLGGYNKASVKTSNYNVGEIFPEEDFDALKLIGTPADVVLDNKVSVKKIYNPNVYRLYHYDIEHLATITEEDFAKLGAEANNMMGAVPVKMDTYNMVNRGGAWYPDITNYTFEDYIQVRLRWGTTKMVKEPILEFRQKLPVTQYGMGALGIQCSIQLSKRPDLANFGTEDVSSAFIGNYVKMPFLVQIGDMYYNGTTWTKTATYIYLEFDVEEIKKGGFVTNKSTKTLSMPYSGLDGYIIELPTKPLTGDMYILMFSIDHDDRADPAYYVNAPKGYFIKDLKMAYKKLDLYDATSSKNSDRIYENVVNDSYINELDEIEFKISSYNNDDISYSKVMLFDDYLTDNLYCSIAGTTVRPEEQLIRRIVSQYDATKIKLNQVLINSSFILPVCRMTDNFIVNKKFLLTGGEVDYEAESFAAIMIEV